MALHIITGSPGCGKSTWMRHTAKSGDIQIGSDELTNALTGKTESKHHHDSIAKKISRAAREAAINEAIKHRHHVDIWVLVSSLTEDKAVRWRKYGARFVVIDPGYDLALQRCRDNRPGYKHRLVDAWYSKRDEWPLGAEVIDPGIIDEELVNREGRQQVETSPEPLIPKSKQGTSARGYGWKDHQQPREILLRQHRDGAACWWCGLPMHKDKAKNWDQKALARDHLEANGAKNRSKADQLLHFTCNSQRQDGRNDHIRPAITGRHPAEPLDKSTVSESGFSFGGVSFRT